MVDLYKQLLVGQNPVKQNESDSTEQIVAEDSEGLGDFQVNPNMLEYGSRIADVYKRQGWSFGRCQSLHRIF